MRHSLKQKQTRTHKLKHDRNKHGNSYPIEHELGLKHPNGLRLPQTATNRSRPSNECQVTRGDATLPVGQITEPSTPNVYPRECRPQPAACSAKPPSPSMCGGNEEAGYKKAMFIIAGINAYVEQ